MQAPEKPKGVIFDAGYRRYDGRFLGRRASILEMAWDDFKRALGFKRRIAYRVGIWILLILQLAVAGFLLFTSELQDAVGRSGGAEVSGLLQNQFAVFFDSTSLFLLILAALIAPNLLCSDRKNRVIPLYMVRPIQPRDYLTAKWLSILGVLALYLIGPALILFLGKGFLAADALQYFNEHQTDLGAILLSGALIALFYSSFAMGVSSLSESVGIAVAMVIGIIFLLDIVTSIIFFISRDPWAAILDIGNSVYRLKEWIFLGTHESVTVEFGPQSRIVIDPMPNWTYWMLTTVSITGSWLLTYVVFRREAQR